MTITSFPIEDVAVLNATLPSMFDGGSERTLGNKLRDWVSVMDFGAIPNDSSSAARTANAAAFAAAHDHWTDVYGTYYRGGIIFIPSGTFYFTDAPWVISRSVKIMGCGGQGDSASSAGTVLRFPGETHGIRLHTHLTAPAPYGGTSSAESTALEDFHLFCEDNDSTSGHGVWSSTRIFANRVSVRNFGGCGWKIWATSTLTPGDDQGEANMFSIINCWAIDNGSHGLHVEGDDVNASTIINFNAKQNLGWGIYERSKFQNAYYTPHLNGNQSGQISDRSGSGCVWFVPYSELFGGKAGSEWAPNSIIIGGTVASSESYPFITISGNGSGADAVAIIDGDGELIKVFPTELGSGYSGTPTVSVVAGTGGGSGAAVTANIVGGAITSYTVTDGGSGYPPSGHVAQRWFDGNIAGLRNFRGRATNGTRVFDIGIIPESDHVLRFKTPGDGTYGMQFPGWFDGNKTYGIWSGLSPGYGMIVCTNLSTGETGGRSAALTAGSIEFPNGFWLGDSTAGRQVKNAASMPNSGEYAQGDFVFNTAPSVDANDMLILGWSRLTTGSNHVLDTDWAACHVSTVSPAT